jgi:hypothetical protein
MEAADLFEGDRAALALHAQVAAVIREIGTARVQVAKSQVGFYHPFAAMWRPSQYLARRHAPLVLSIYLKRRDDSSRWKEVVEPIPGRFTHHLELRSAADIDDFVRARLAEAWAAAA